MNPQRFGILLFRGTGVISAMIRWQTRSAYAHAALLLPDGSIIEAMQFAGVRQRPFGDDEWKDVDLFDVPSLTGPQWLQAASFAQAQIGKPYDYVGILRFISRRHNPYHDKWFCSALVYDSVLNGGEALLGPDNIPSERKIIGPEVSPGRLFDSTKISFIPRPGAQISLGELHTLNRGTRRILAH